MLCYTLRFKVMIVRLCKKYFPLRMKDIYVFVCIFAVYGVFLGVFFTCCVSVGSGEHKVEFALQPKHGFFSLWYWVMKG